MKIKLHTQIFTAMILGLLTGILLQDKALVFEPIGEIFISLLKMIMAPIIFASITMGILSLGNLKNLSKIGVKTLIYYLSTSSIAVITGLTVSNIIQPGKNGMINITSNTDAIINNTYSMNSFLIEMVPKNIFVSLVEEKMINIIFFTIIFACALMSISKKAEPIINFIDALNSVLLKITDWIMVLSPYGVFALISTLIAKTGLATLKPLSLYLTSVILGLGIHLLISLPLILYAITKYPPALFFKRMFPALATAFSTDSSIATLPVTMECLEKNIKIPNKITSFVAPLGATINMDGTALYEAMAALFIAQMYGIDLSITQQIIICIASIFASIGAAGIPSAGLVTLIIVLRSANLPIEGIGLLLAVDRILDMCRTTVNVAGDACGSIIIAKLENEILDTNEIE